MPPTFDYFTDGMSNVSALGIAVTALMGILLVILPRRFALLPVVVLICFMTMGQRILVGGLNFTAIRILLIFGWIRLVVRWEFVSLPVNELDKAILWWGGLGLILYCMLWQSADAFKYALGGLYNAVGFYFLFRYLVRELSDVIRVFKMIAVLALPLAAAMTLEKLTGRNPFAIFGGVPEFTAIRDGVLRCEGPFAHPILAGSFGAAILPLALVLWPLGKSGRVCAVIGAISAAVITITSGSSGPLMAFMASILGLTMWRWRQHLRTVRWGLLLTIIFLQLVMKSPVWFLMARVDIFSGSTGYHRALLIDRAVANLNDWWLVGTQSTVSWDDPDMGLFDVTNQYLLEGANGGLLRMALFILLIVRGYRGVGRSVRMLQNSAAFPARFCIWGLGASLFSHTVTYMSVSYFDQNSINWFLLLAIIASVSDQVSSLTRTKPSGNGKLAIANGGIVKGSGSRPTAGLARFIAVPKDASRRWFILDSPAMLSPLKASV